MRTVSRLLTITLSFTLALTLFAAELSAQVLARPGWAGSGVTVDAWWKRGVFYRIDPTLFQDSDGDGVGDLDGIAQRLDYVQQLGVDAVILEQPKQGRQLGPEDVGAFVRKAAEAHVRVLVELTSTDPAQARMWLSQGIAGLFIDMRSQSTHGVAAASVVRELRRAVDSFPGGRVLVANGILPSPDGAQLSVSGSFSTVQTSAGFLRDRLQTSLDVGTPTGAPLLEVSGLAVSGKTSESEQEIAERALATVLLASRAAVIFDAGRELGLRSAEGKSVAMQWTPSNVTRPEPAPEPVRPAAPKPEVYGAYVPYVPPTKPVAPAPKPPAPSTPTAPPPPDPNTLPGFTSGSVLEGVAVNGTSANAASEDADQNSLLNFYRHLIALHHDNGSIRNGSETIFNRDDLGVLAWVRRAPAGSRTAASVVVTCNLSGRPAEISFSEEFDDMHIRGGSLRPLLTASVGQKPLGVVPVQSAERLTLPPYSVFVGEIYHYGSGEPAQTMHHSSRKRRRY